MVGAAESAGLDGIGFTDHCNVSERTPMYRRKIKTGFNLDVTYERRRKAIDRIRADDDVDVFVFDAVEMDYDPRDEAAVRDFLDESDFDYALGSVHYLEDTYVTRDYFAEKSTAEREALVETFYDRVVALAESELFDIAAHVDVLERSEHFRGLSTREHYDRVADAFADSRTVPEVNGGRASEGYFHPSPGFVEAFVDRGVALTVGSDAHHPRSLQETVPALEAHLEELGVDPVAVVEPDDVT
jgi:histidinol-phosphatase (PHP family)